MGNKIRKPKYFIELYEEMKQNPKKSFWEGAPLQDTVFGKVTSYVLFRCVGVDVAKYIHCKVSNGESILGEDVKSIPTIDYVSVEFLHAWLYEPVIGDLQLEGLTLRLLMDDKSFQLWLVEILSKIPVIQWYKVEKKFIATCGNVLYMAVYLAWLRVVQGNGDLGILNKLPNDLTLLERYVLSQTLCGFELDEHCIERVNYYKTNAKRQESLTIWLGHAYRNNKHSYSGKHMYAARNAGARMVVYGANNLAVTLRLIFKKNQYKVK